MTVTAAVTAENISQAEEISGRTTACAVLEAQKRCAPDQAQRGLESDKFDIPVGIATFS